MTTVLNYTFKSGNGGTVVIHSETTVDAEVKSLRSRYGSRLDEVRQNGFVVWQCEIEVD